MKGDAGNGICNDTTFFIASCHAADICLTCDGPAVNQLFIISRNHAIVPAGNAAYIVIPGDGGRFIVDQIGQSRIFSIFSDETAYVPVAGDLSVIAAIGDGAGVCACQTAYVVAGLPVSGFAGDVRRISHVGHIRPGVFTENAAHVVAAADNAFVVSTFYSAARLIDAGDAAHVVGILCSYIRIMLAHLINTGGDAEAVHIVELAFVHAGHAAEGFRTTSTGIDGAVGAAAGNLAGIRACNPACYCTLTACRCNTNSRYIGNFRNIFWIF